MKKHPPEVLYKKAVLKDFCAGVSTMLRSLFNKVAGLKAPKKYPNRTPTQVFPYDYYEIFKNIYFEEHLRMAASDDFQILISQFQSPIVSARKRSLECLF